MLKDLLLKEGIVRIKSSNEEPFVLKSGKKSRLFIDIKEASLNPVILRKIVTEIVSFGRPFNTRPSGSSAIYNYDKIASVAVGGIPIATALSLTIGIPQVIVRSEKHDRGMKSQVIGNCQGMSCILIEDVATSGGSLVSAVLVLRAAGATCDDCVVIVDREEGAQELCKENNIVLRSLLKKSDFGIAEEI